MSPMLRVELAQSEGALTRLIGLVERRGYSIRALDMTPGADGVATAMITVDPRNAGRRIETLERQIERLFDVIAVSAMPAAHAIAATSQGGMECRPRA